MKESLTEISDVNFSTVFRCDGDIENRNFTAGGSACISIDSNLIPID